MADDIVSFGMEIDSSAARKAKQDLNSLAQSGPAVEQALKKIDGAGRSGATGMRAVSAAAQSVERDMQAMRRAALGWSSAIGAVFAGFSAMSVIDAADQWGQYASRMMMATQTAEEYAHAQDRMVQSAQTTFRSINETRESFIQLSPVLREMGYSLDQSIDAVDAFSGLLVVSGANAERGANAMNALAKSLQKGKVDAEAWMTIYSTADTIVEHLAKSSGLSAEEIRKLGAAGQISAQMMAQALVTGYLPVIKAVEGMPTTVRDAFTNLNTQFTEYVGRANEANGATQNIVTGINTLSENFTTIANGVVIAGEAVAVVIGARMAAAAGTSAVAFAVASVQAVRYQAALARMAGVSVAAAAGLSAVSVAGRAASAAMTLFGGPLGTLLTVIGGAALAISSFKTEAAQANAEVGGLSRSVDLLNGSLTDFTKNQAESAIFKLKDQMQALADQSVAVNEQMYRVREWLRFDPNGSRAPEWRRMLVDLQSEADGLNQKMATLGNRMLEFAAIMSAAPTPKLSEEATKYLDGINKQIARLEDAGDPLKEATRFLREHTDATADQSEAIMTAAKRQKELQDARKKSGGGARDQAKELQNTIAKLAEEQATLGMTEAAAERYRIEQMKGSAADRQRALDIYDQVQAWKEADKAIKQAAETSRLARSMAAETDVFRQQQFAPITGMGLGDRIREQLQAELQVQQQFAQRRRELDEAQMVESTRISESQYQTRLRLLQENEDAQIAIIQAAAATKKAKEADWSLGAMDALRNYQDSAENVYQSIGQMVQNSFRGMEDALTTFVTTGKLSFKDLADSIISDMVRIAIQQSITGPLAGALGGALSGIFGGSSLPSTASWALPVMPSAKGNVFGSGSDLEYYRNTIVSSPTLFQFAKGGAFGLMGEAGPEAIMPLKRGPDGRLGVSTHGGGGSGDVTVNVINNSSQPVTASQPKISMDLMGRMVVEVMIADLQRNGPYARQLKGAL